MKRFEGKSVLITGGTSGIGFATAKRFLHEGARVAVTGRRPDAVLAAQKELGPSAVAWVSRADNLEDVQRLVEDVRSAFGQLDALFINAGIAKFASIDQVSAEHFDEIFATNVRGPLFTIQALIPLLRDGASVVLNASVVDEKGYPGTIVYSASKAALRSFARTLSAELMPRRIRVNVVSPGPIATPIFEKTGMSREEIEKFGAEMRSLTPMGRFGNPDEVAAAVAYLASNDATFTTGAELTVDGGIAHL